MKKLYRNILLFTAICLLTFVSFGCKKLVEVSLPVGQTTSEAAFSEDATAISFVTGTYTKIGPKRFDGFLSLSFLAGLSADELKVFDVQSYGIYLAAYKNRLSAYGGSSVSAPEFWATLYSFIYNANVAIEKLSTSKTLAPAIRNYLIGEAKFMRAYCHFYLLNLYGDVPLVISTDWRVNASIPRSPKQVVYGQIILDLNDAKALLPNAFLSSNLKDISPDRVRPTKWAALAMLSKVYLYTGDYSKAEEAASEVIENTVFNLPVLNNAFLRSSPETIWSIQSTDGTRNTQEAQLFVLTGSPTTNFINPFFINSDLLNAFEPNDPRKTNWIGNVTAGGTIYYFPKKYKAIATNGGVQTEYSVLLRLGEVFLNRAEARAQQNKIQECIDDLNTIRTRARGSSPTNVLPNYVNNLNKTQAINACIQERRVELFTELGNRWLDLKRSGTINEVMNLAASGKGTTWDPNWALYPIYNQDIERNTALLGHQNPGY